jgi:hypothetical protein
MGILFDEVLVPAFGHGGPSPANGDARTAVPIEPWPSLAFSGAYLIMLFLLSFPYAMVPTFSPGEKEAYDWIRANTEPDATFIMEGGAENLVYFGRRTILLPVFGAEWLPSPDYGNGKALNGMVKDAVYTCREVECLISALEQYGVAPTYIVYRVSDGQEEAWIDELGRSSHFEVAFASEALVTLRRH